MKVKSLLIGLTSLFGALTIGYSAMNLYTLNSMNHYVQEWKDILLRGNDPDLYDKYYKQFKEREKTVDSKLRVLSKTLKDLHYVKEASEIDGLIEQHIILGDKYNEALGDYDKQDMGSFMKVDLKVRGIDRPTSKAMDAVSKDIVALTDESFKKINDDVENNYNKRMFSLLTIASIGLIFLIITSLSISNKIFKSLGNEPEELNGYFAELARGNLKVGLDVKGKDKSSLSYNAKLMQYKLKNLISAVYNSSNEVDEAIQQIQRATSEDSKQEAIQEAKSVTKILRNLTDRFEV